MPFSVTEFHGVAGRLPDETPIYLKPDPSSPLSSNRHMVTAKPPRGGDLRLLQERARGEFFTALRTEYGATMSGLAAQHLGDRPLTARAVRDTVALIEGRGGRHWLANDNLIQDLARLPTPTDTAPAFLTTLVNSVCDEMTGGRTPRVHPSLGMISSSIKNRLQEVALVRGEGGHVSYRALTSEEARGIAREVARGEVLQYMNGQAKRAYQTDPAHSVQNVFRERCRRAGLDRHFPLMPPEAQAALELSIDKRFALGVANASVLLSQEQIATMLESLLDRYFEEAGKKLAAISGLLPPETSKGPLTTACLSTRDATNFEQLVAASSLLGSMMRELARAPETGQLGVAFTLGRQWREIFGRAGLSEPDAIVSFMEQARILLETREGPKPFAASREIGLSAPLAKLRDIVIKAAMDHASPDAPAAAALFEVFKLFSSSLPRPPPPPPPPPSKGVSAKTSPPTGSPSPSPSPSPLSISGTRSMPPPPVKMAPPPVKMGSTPTGGTPPSTGGTPTPTSSSTGAGGPLPPSTKLSPPPTPPPER